MNEEWAAVRLAGNGARLVGVGTAKQSRGQVAGLVRRQGIDRQLATFDFHLAQRPDERARQSVTAPVLGKTISAGLILSELMVRRRVSRTLVLCPKILGPQWAQELDEKFGIHASDVVGNELGKEIARGAPVVVTTYQSATKRLGTIPAGAFDMLILDEAHKLRNLHGTDKPPHLATAVREALRERRFKYVLMLTATPIQNRLWDLFSLIDCLTVARGHQNPLGTSDSFKRTYLDPGSDGRRLNPSRADQFRQIVRQYIVRTRRMDCRLLFPTREVCQRKVTLSPAERQLNQLVGTLISDLNPLLQTSVAQAMMSSPPALRSLATVTHVNIRRILFLHSEP